MKEKLSKYWVVILSWLILTAINANKAFHIDDTFHLEMALQLQQDPGHPMSGTINWDNDPKPLYRSNHPPFFFYLLAGTMRLFGEGELLVHLLLSAFTLSALIYFQWIVRLQGTLPIPYGVALFAAVPALVINQNILLEVPVLAMLLIGCYYLLRARERPAWKSYVLATLALTVGMLFKYSMAPAFVAMLLLILVQGHFRYLVVFVIPAIALAIWSYWNILEFGAVHLLTRYQRPFDYYQLWALIACLGAMVPFTILLFGNTRARLVRKLLLPVWLGLVVLFGLSVLLFVRGVVSESTYSYYLNWSFFANGLLISGALLWQTGRYFHRYGTTHFFRSNTFFNLLFLGGFSLFTIFYAPFIATRHILLLTPFILLLGGPAIMATSKLQKKVVLVVSILFTGLLALSDWYHADYYRQKAAGLAFSPGARVWSLGHWGWQWYADKAGFRQYHRSLSLPRHGDYVVYPAGVHKQAFRENIPMEIEQKYWEESDWKTLFSGKEGASLYSSFYGKSPWRLSCRPIDTILVARVNSRELTYQTQLNYPTTEDIDSTLTRFNPNDLIPEAWPPDIPQKGADEQLFYIAADREYSLQHRLQPVKPFEQIQLRFYVLGDAGSFQIVASSPDVESFYQAQIPFVVSSERSGWQETVVNIFLPPDYNGDQLDLYLWKPQPTVLYIDEVHIQWYRY